MELHIFVNQERDNLFLARPIGAAAGRGHGFHTRPANDTRERVFGYQNCPRRQLGSNLGHSVK